jgi:crotonobetainyl-CoA:carnitine CoA-transferase CaiB-like acyl-CoA transferase
LHDDRLEKRGFWEEIDHPVIGSMPMFRLPFVNEPDIRIPMTRPPTLGEHTWEVAADLLGMDRATFDDLTEREVFY